MGNPHDQSVNVLETSKPNNLSPARKEAEAKQVQKKKSMRNTWELQERIESLKQEDKERKIKLKRYN